MFTRPSRFSPAGALLVGATLLLGIAAAVEAAAHHPGSHAGRDRSGAVRLDAVVPVADSCTTIGGIALGAPPSVRAPADAEPVTVTLARPADAACAGVVGAAQAQAVLPVPAGRTRLQLYVLRPDGTLAASERVPIR